MTRIRTETPLAFFVPGFLLGQLAALCFGRFVLLGLLPIFGVFVLLRRPMLLATSGFVAGVVVLLAAAPIERRFGTDVAASYLFEVQEPIRHPKPGLIRLVARVVAARAPGQERYHAVGPAAFLCKGVHLPWKNVSLLRQGDRAVARGQFVFFQERPPPFSSMAQLKRRGIIGRCKLRYVSKPVLREEPIFHALRRSLTARIRLMIGDHEGAGLVLSMSLGIRDVLSRETEQAFKQTGLSHVLVLPGPRSRRFDSGQGHKSTGHRKRKARR